MKNSTLAIDTFVPALRSLSGLLDKGADFARSKSMDPNALLNERLAPDMFTLSSQVQIACHHAKDGTARATGTEPPKIKTEDLTLDQLKTLIAQTIQLLTETRPDAFDGAESRKIELSLQGGRVLEADGLQFQQHWSFPHFYFHIVTAYDILRHVGVPLGKRDYLSGISQGYIRQGAPA